MYSVTKKGSVNGEITVPGSKSHTIRAVLLATMADGTSVITNPLPSLDCKSALEVARCFGATTTEAPGVWTVVGCGRNLKLPDNYVDCGNSGSTAYFAAPMAALTDGYTFLTGDAQIRRRPVKPVLDAINQLGGEAFPSRPDSLACPAIIKGKMKGGKVTFDGQLSQFISGIMLAAPLLEQDTEIEVQNPNEKPYLQMTIDWMKRYGVTLKENSGDYKRFVIEGRQSYHATEALVPSDWSGVAFPLVAAVTTPSHLVISGVDFADSQGDKAVVEHLIAMGAQIAKDPANHRMTITGGVPLTSGLTIDLSDIPDSLPALSVAACYANGDTTFTGLAHVRVKETDRVAVMEQELTKLGASIETGPDYMIVHGGKPLTATEVDSHDDHRIAMALTVAGLFAKGEMRVKDAQCASVSFPNFYEVMNNAGAGIALTD